MTTADSQPHLRLVRPDDLSDDVATPAARREVAAENRHAASRTDLNPVDPRWVLAVRAYSQLQGSALPYDRRQRVLQTARALGVRPFDANVIIAIVQDHARRGARLHEATGTLALLHKPEPGDTRGRGSTWLRWASALVCAMAGTAFLVWWVTG
jgi:hypothetical protein